MGDVLGYARVSPGDEDLAGQRQCLKQAGALQMFEDVLVGKAIDRPGLQALLAYARPGDKLAVVRLDRLGRSLQEVLSTITTLRESNIALLSLEERIDTSLAAGELIFHIFGVIAQLEFRVTDECAGDATAAYAKNKHSNRHQVSADTITAALKLVETGLSPVQVARQAELDGATLYHEMALAAARKGGA